MNTLREFIYGYAENMLKAIDENYNLIAGIEWDCNYCPLRAICREASDSGDTQTCGGFLMNELNK